MPGRKRNGSQPQLGIESRSLYLGFRDGALILPSHPARSWQPALAMIVGVALVERLALAWLYPVRAFSDTGAYRRAAQSIASGWSHYDGVRTPGYPAFLALWGGDARVYLAQLGLGVTITLIFFFLGWRLWRSPVLGLAAALAHTLNLGQLFFEAHLLSETLATFWVVVSLGLAWAWFEVAPRWRPWLGLGVGISAALAGLTRPLFVFLPFWLGLALALMPVLSAHGGLRQRLCSLEWRTLLAVVLPAAVLIGAWMAFIHARFGMWNVTTMTGYNLIQHTGYYFEYVPDEYAALRDVYLRYRDARMAQYGTQTNAIWQAIPEMMQASGLGFYDLSRTLARLSWQLIREPPTLYLHYVLKGWWLFWRAPIVWVAENFRLPALLPWVTGLIWVERGILFATNLLFLVGSAGWFLLPRVRRGLPLHPYQALLAATVWVTSVVQTLPDHGDNPRFLVPMQSLVVIWVLGLGVAFWKRWQARRKP